MDRKEAIEIIESEQFPDGLLREALETLIPELESKDERIRKTLIRLFTADSAEQYGNVTSKQIITWLEKQGNDNLISGRNIAISLIKYLDDNRYEGAMNMSNMECEDLEKAILDSDWSKVYRYMKKKLEKQGEQKSVEWSEEDNLHYKQAIYVCHQNGYTAVENWLKSFKDKYKNAVEYDKICLEKQGEKGELPTN